MSDQAPIRITLVFLIALMLGAVLLTGCATRPLSGAVAADHPLASEAGAEMLRRGGNAVDAAVATSLALSVVRPDACGIGGGGFMVIHLENDPRHGTIDAAINYRETCPAGVGPGTYEQWNDPLASRDGGRAVGVPGTVAGLIHALEKYGTLDRETVFGPAIRLAEQGWEADRHHVERSVATGDRIAAHDGYAERFGYVDRTLTDGGSIAEGDMLRNPGQARALRLIAQRGRAGFYEGPVADAIVDAVQGDGGVLTHADLLAYEVSETEPISITLGNLFGGRRLVAMPPPSSGGIVIAQVFAILELAEDRLGFAMPATGQPSPADTHVLIEATKHAFADRARHLADPAFVDLPVYEMLDHDNLASAADRITPGQTLPHAAYGVYRPDAARMPAPLPEDGGTSHISVIDRHGNAVSCTETINLSFGSLLTAEPYGFCLNNEMDDFTTVRGAANAFGLAQSDANLPEPGKRPLSSMSPTIVFEPDGSVLAVAGASGGPRIINGAAQSLLRVLLADATAAEAVNAPRYHHQWSPDTLFVETSRFVEQSTGARDALAAALEEFGHVVHERSSIAACQLVRKPATRARPYDAQSDPRKGGAPAWERD